MAVALREKMAPSSRDECSKIVWIDAVTLHHQMNDRIGKHVFKQGFGTRARPALLSHGVGIF